MASIGNTITSPAKLAYAGFVAFVALDKAQVTIWPFLVVTLAFIVIQVWHDDYLRIRLNNRAELKSTEERRKGGFTRTYDDIRPEPLKPV